MQETTTPTLQDDDVEHRDPTEKFSFIRAAAGFVLDAAPQGGLFSGPPPEPAPATIESVEVVDLPPMAVQKPPPTPLAHRLMVFALIPFVLVAVTGLIVINRPSPRRQHPPALTATTVPVTAAPVAESGPPPAPTTPPPSLYTPAPTVPITRAPRAPVAVTETTQPPATTPTTEPPPTTTPTTEPPPTTTPTTEPPTTTPTTQPETTPPTFVEQP